MKKIALVSLLAISALGAQSAFAQTTICVRATASHAGVAPAYGTAGTHYMVQAITPKCSANVLLQGIDGTQGAWYSVAANSNKGKNTFGASTGGFNVQTGCTSNCTDGEVGTVLTASNRGT